MKMKSVLGIDLGTSSVKILQRYEDGRIQKAKAIYKERNQKGWWQAVKKALSELELKSVEAIGLSSQVGTYLVNDTWVNHWNDGVGEKELTWLKEEISQNEFLEEISMPHPDITSYPLPRLKYSKEHDLQLKKVCQPKDFLCEMLTGNLATDKYSWRGLANLTTGKYSEKLLGLIGISERILPKVLEETACAGLTRRLTLDEDNKRKELPPGIPVFVGMNDFFSGLLGMGICSSGEMFDISGTSEHIGVIEKKIHLNSPLVSGPYLKANVHYGVTASSGASLEFGMKLRRDAEGVCLEDEKIFQDGKVLYIEEMQKKQPPIFLPYLSGERAPIWDKAARGSFVGIKDGCTQRELAYSVFEGVVFSLFHIYETMGKPQVHRLKVTGGAAQNPFLNFLKAELFELPVEIMAERDASALGAAMVASIGLGWFSDYEEATERVCQVQERIEPVGRYTVWLKKRFGVYKELYPALKEQYQIMRRLDL